MTIAQPRSIPAGLRSAYNGTGADIGYGLAVKASTAIDEGVLLPAASTDPVLGITRALIKNGEFGTVQTRGLATAIAGAAVTRGDRVMATAAGKLITFVAGAGNAVVGIAKQTTTADGEEFEVELSGPANFATT